MGRMDIETRILHRDDDLIVADKPAGLASIAERDLSQPCLHRELERALGTRLWIVHRLDKGVSGVIVFARNAEAHRHLNGEFASRRARKTYLAWAHGALGPEPGIVRQPLREYGSGRVAVDPRRGKPCETAYRVLRRTGERSLLEVEPRTGRRHQIRAHLYAIGHPIVGDPLYGDTARASGEPRLLLHAWRLALRHPAGDELTWEAPPGPEFGIDAAELASARK